MKKAVPCQVWRLVVPIGGCGSRCEQMWPPGSAGLRTRVWALALPRVCGSRKPAHQVQPSRDSQGRGTRPPSLQAPGKGRPFLQQKWDGPCPPQPSTPCTSQMQQAKCPPGLPGAQMRAWAARGTQATVCPMGSGCRPSWSSGSTVSAPRRRPGTFWQPLRILDS